MSTKIPAGVDQPRRPADHLEPTPASFVSHYLDDLELNLDLHDQQWREKAEQLRVWARRWVLDGWVKLDQEALLSVVTDDFVCEDPALMGTECRGRDAYREFLADTLRAFPDSRFIATDPPFLALDGTQLILPWRATGHFAGPLRLPGSRRTLAPTGRSFDFPGVDIYTFRGEQVSHLRSIYDTAEVIRQLAIVPGVDFVLHRVAPVLQPPLAAIQRRLGR
jgi:predicted ester cyclase